MMIASLLNAPSLGMVVKLEELWPVIETTVIFVAIGLVLFAMGVGSWLSRFVDKNLAERFIEIELSVAVVGGFSAPLLFLTFAHISYFSIVLYGIVFMIGVLVGLEIPLLMRILK